MNNTQKKRCHAIIHSHAIAAAAGNALPTPGLGIAADAVTMTSMTMALCAVFGGNITTAASKTLAIAAIKNTALKQPIKTLSKELSKLIPGLGQIVSPGISIVMLESAGWILANELYQACCVKRKASLPPEVGSIADIIQKNVTPPISLAEKNEDEPKRKSIAKNKKIKASAKKTQNNLEQLSK